MMCAGAYVTCTSGGGTLSGLAPDVVLPRQMRIGVADTPDEVRRAVRELVNGGADLVKVIATGAVLAPGTHPGAADTEFSKVRFKGDMSQAEKIYEGYTPLRAEDVADTIYYCASLPAHVCINDLIITPTQQADAFYFNRNQ